MDAARHRPAIRAWSGVHSHGHGLRSVDPIATPTNTLPAVSTPIPRLLLANHATCACRLPSPQWTTPTDLPCSRAPTYGIRRYEARLTGCPSGLRPVSWPHVSHSPRRAAAVGRGDPRAGPRPRRPAGDVPQHAPDAGDRGARQPALQGRALPGSYYTGRGNEGASVGVATAMGEDDIASPLHRNMGVHVVRGVRPGGDLLPVHGTVGRRDPRPRLEPAHQRLRPGHGLLAGVSHLPAMIPVITGIALAFQLRSEPRVALGWCGDGAAARGDMHESMNLAGVRQPAHRLHHRQQPVRLLDAQQAVVRLRARWQTAARRTGSRASSSTAPTCSTATARRTARSRRRARAAARP